MFNNEKQLILVMVKNTIMKWILVPSMPDIKNDTHTYNEDGP